MQAAGCLLSIFFFFFLPSTAGGWTYVSCRACEFSAHKAQGENERKLFMANIHMEVNP